MKEEISKAFASLQIPVQWGDMDAAQHVNNTVYLRWMESVRIEFFKILSGGNMDFRKIAPILAWQDCKYIFPVTFPDDIVITYDVTVLKSDRIICRGNIYSKKHDRLVAIGNTSVMAYDFKALKKQEIPQKWVDMMIDFYGNSIMEGE